LRFEVLNTGVSGYNTRQELATLREIGLRLAPDVIVLNVCLNDSDPVKQLYGVALKNETKVSGWADVNLRTMVESSYLLTLLKHAVTKVIKLVGGNVRTLNSPKLFLDSRVRETAWQKMKATMAEIHEEASQAGIPMAVIIYPYSSQLSLPADQRVPQQDLLAFFATRGVPALDATPAYTKLGQSMFIDEYVHLSPQGHRQIAAAIADHLLAHGLLPVATLGRPNERTGG
jgi:lysophospholipase L1-like esterase